MTLGLFHHHQLEECPLTHRLISRRCWNTIHQEGDDKVHKDCDSTNCQCYCHDLPLDAAEELDS
jgi:hypothetical protein